MDQNTIYWDIGDFEFLPGDNDWLSENEKKILETKHFLKRRNEWRLGRWVAKNAVLKFADTKKSLSLQEIEVLPGETGAPFIVIKGQQKPPVISISHREKKAICAITEKRKPIGCDLEWIEPRSKAFIYDYFTGNELVLVDDFEDNKDLISNLVWSAKESVAKILQLGLNLDTRDINVHHIDFSKGPEWKDINIMVKNTTPFYGKWRQISNFVVTFASDTEIDIVKKL